MSQHGIVTGHMSIHKPRVSVDDVIVQNSSSGGGGEDGDGSDGNGSGSGELT